MSRLEIQEWRSTVAGSRSRILRFLLILVLLLGFALRIHDLEGQSMWSDEGLSLYRARLSLADISQNVITVDGIDTRDTNPPFYFMLLHLWRNAAGESIFALRFLGVALSTLAIPLIYALGTIAFGRSAGFVASLLMAISPFHVWQSQVLRNYGVLITLNLLSVYGLFRFILSTSGRRRFIWLVVWAAAALIGIYTHYFSFLIFAFGLLSLTLHGLQQLGIKRLARQRWLWVGLGLALLVLLPAVFISLDRFRAGAQVDFFFVPVHKVIYQAASAFSVGMDPSLVHPWWRVLPVVVLAILGVIFGWRTRRKATLLLLGYQLIPLGLLFSLSLINPLYNGTRHLLIGLPPFILFVAEGIVGPLQSLRWSRAKWVRFGWASLVIALSVLLVISQIDWLRVQFTSPRLVRDDIRGAAEYLNIHAEPDDLVLIHDTLIRFTFDYYYHGSAPVRSIPRYDQADVLSAVDDLKDSVQPGKRTWFLAEPAPRNGMDRQALTDWTRVNWPAVLERQFPWMWLHVGLNAYVPQPEVALIPATAVSHDSTWPEVLQMRGYEIPPEATSGADWWLTFYLSQLQANPVQHTLSLRLIDENGQEWAQVDDVVKRGFPPVASEPETLMRYDHQVSVPAGLPPGKYQVWMRLVETSSGQAVPLSSGEFDVRLSDVTIRPANCIDGDEQLSARNYPRIRLGREIELLAYDWPEGEYRPGHDVSVNLWWCARRTPKSDYLLRLRLMDDGGQVVAESIGPLSRSDYPPTLWQPGQMVMSKAGITIPAQAEEQQYELHLSLIEPDSNEGLPVRWPLGQNYFSLGTVEVTPWPIETELPPISQSLQANFGQPTLIELHGYEISATQLAPGEIFDLTFIWRALDDNIPASYSIFVHLADNEEQIVAQDDGIPVGGFRPTTSWRTGEVLIDAHQILLPADMATGTYNMWVGFFDPDTGQRLPIFRDGEPQPDDRLLLQTMSVGE